MNIQDELTIFFLHVFDLAMNLVTFRGWQRWQGARVVGLKPRRNDE